MRGLMWLVALGALLLGAVNGDCGSDYLAGLSLSSWSALFGANVVGGVTIASGSQVVVDLPSINIDGGLYIAPGASLYVDWSIDVNITVNHISVSGLLQIGTEGCPYEKKAIITLNGTTTEATFGRRFLGVAQGGSLELHGSKGSTKAWTKLRVSAAKGGSVLSVVDAVATNTTAAWRPGDRIVLASSDFDPNQSELLTITGVIDSQTITVSPNLTYPHFGAITYGVDERAEVGLLTRSIVIRGVDDSANPLLGGHFMVAVNFTAVHVEAVEFYNMGQDEIARYPIHFHLCRSVPAGTYVRRNSIWKSNFRCVTIHSTSNLLVEENVGYDILGHCYFLEDGMERNNTIINNLAVSIKGKETGQRTGSDFAKNGLSAFWITNPDNTFVGNVAVGSLNAGYWFHTRKGPRGVSGCISEFWSQPKPADLPLKNFTNNVAHSCTTGLGVESTNWDKDDYPQQTCQQAGGAEWEARYPNNSPWAPVWFYGFTAYKIQDRALWARLPNARMVGAKFADNFESIQYATSGSHPSEIQVQTVEDSLVVGFSDNVGYNAGTTDYQKWDSQLGRSMPRTNDPTCGWKMYDGPQNITNTVFRNFYVPATVTAKHSAIGSRLSYNGQIAASDLVRNCSFVNVTYRFHIIDDDDDGGKQMNFQDIDGSVSGYPGSHVLVNWGIYRTPNCVITPVHMLTCPHRYANVWVVDALNTVDKDNNNLLTVTRNHFAGTNYSDATIQFTGFSSSDKWRYQPLLSVGSSYLLTFSRFIPARLWFQINNVWQNDWIGIAVCYPPNTVINNVYRGYAYFNGNNGPELTGDTGYTTITPDSARNTPDVQNGDKYYFDSTRNILFVTVKQRLQRTTYGNFCPDGGCDWVWVDASFANATAVDCRASAYSGVDSIQESNSQWLLTTLQGSSSAAATTTTATATTAAATTTTATTTTTTTAAATATTAAATTTTAAATTTASATTAAAATTTTTTTATTTTTSTTTGSTTGATSTTLYVIGGASWQTASTLSLTLGSQIVDIMNRSRLNTTNEDSPYLPLNYTITGLSRNYVAGSSLFSLWLDAGTEPRNTVQARISYDFTGDGVYDRVELYKYYAVNSGVGWEQYTQTKGIQSTSGTYASSMSNGVVLLQVWSALGDDPSQLLTGNSVSVSSVTIPYA